MSNISVIAKLLSTNGYIQVNKYLIKKFGLYEAVLLGELCSEYTYWESKNLLEDESFYSTRENIENNTGLSDHQQRSALKTLIDNNIIHVIKRGVPAKNYYKINFEALLQALNQPNNQNEEEQSGENIEQQEVENFNVQCFKNSSTSTSKIEAQVVENFNINNNNNKNNNKNNEEITAKAVSVKTLPVTEEEKINTPIINTTPFDNENNIYNIKGGNNNCVDNDELNNHGNHIEKEETLYNNDVYDDKEYYKLISGKLIKKTSKSPKYLKEYITNLQNINGTEVNGKFITTLLKWYYEVGVGITSIKQLETKLNRIFEDCNQQLNLVTQAIDMAYVNGWKAFYAKTTNNKSTISSSLILNGGNNFNTNEKKEKPNPEKLITF